MKFKKSWLIPVALTVAAGFLVLQNGFAPATRTDTTAVATTPIIVTDPPAYEGCAYAWAYHDALELTTKIDKSVRRLDPKASARASLYGEDCVYADGRADFHVMETDFYVRRPVDDLASQETLGDWVAQVMALIVKIPRAEIQGNYGFVEFRFEKNELEHTVLRIPIQRYMDEAQGKSGGELYRMFSAPP